MSSIDTTKKCFVLKTIQISSIKVLLEALRDILTESNIEISADGVKITATDASVTIMVNLLLNADKFEFYYCKEKIIIGLNILNLFRLLKTMMNTDTLTLFMDEDDQSKLGIIIENEETNKVTNYKLNLIDIDEASIEAPATDFVSVITMPSFEFQKVCRDASQISDVIEIKSIGQQLIFSCQGEFASQETIYGETTDNGVSFEKSDNEEVIVQGYYDLKNLTLFAKCANLCQNIKMFLDNEFPIVIEFSVGNLGSLKMALAPNVQE